ncbi:MAG: metal-dependent hydrolase [Gemmatimonadota bacterium]|jgi:L-ascorbate metabolism protein UlaG (beta-lactamase superfamily)|nr:metal-dependent hydrolase [Gemmatimonadota bacterium]MDP6528998.1 metal-dependent hydrolase [Gemmatimonadota bacterium]MDP6802261.1 metal-dependent hydrolase [Gemmatimonadota bacterium]
MKLRFLGHSAFLVETSSGRSILIDPFLTGNPVAVAGPEDFPGVDLVLVTHDHEDHLGDSFDICKQTGATLVAIYETAARAQEEGIVAEPMSIGGAITLDGLVINMVNAQHGAGQGHAAGFVLEVDGKALYFAGDTALFGDMKLFGDLWDLDFAALPVGDRFTMGPAHAAMAVKFLRPTHVVPTHYATFPIILPDASDFVRRVEDLAQVHALEPGQSMSLD